MLLSGVAGAQIYSQASVSGLVLSEGPRGFMLEGPDGNYGIVVATTTIVTDQWNSIVHTGPGNVQPGDYVTAIGIPIGQWIMRANQVVVRTANPPVVYPPIGVFNGSPLIPGAVFTSPQVFGPVRQSVNFNTLPSPLR